jgi:hypothetical protein
MAEGVKDIVSKLIDSVPSLLIVLGVLLLVLGLSGGITYNQWLPIPDLTARIASIAVGAIILGLGVSFGWVAKTRTPALLAKNFGIEIEHPRNGDVVGTVDVRGTLKKAPPDGYTLKIFRIYPGSGSFLSVGDAKVKSEDGTWEAEQCDIGGKTGDRRALAG